MGRKLVREGGEKREKKNTEKGHLSWKENWKTGELLGSLAALGARSERERK